MNQTGFQSAFASLLASENINVSFNPRATTASFDIVNRQLELPVLQDYDEELEYGFLSHEVSHALYTDMDDVKAALAKYGKNKVNIAEDLRIERLIKAKYPGVARKLPKAWSKFLPRFFEGGMQITENFWTRVNAELKTDISYTVPFTLDERKAISEIRQLINNDGSLMEILDLIESFTQEELTEEPTDSESQEDQTNESSEEESEESSEEESEESSEEESEESSEEESESDSGSSDDESEEAEEEESDSDETSTEGEGESDETGEEEETESTTSDELEAGESGSGEDDDHDPKADDEEIKNPTFDDLEKNNKHNACESISDEDLNINDFGGELLIDTISFQSDSELRDSTSFKNFLKTYNGLAQNMLQQFNQKRQAYNYALMSEQDTGDLNSDLFSEYLTREDLFHDEQIEPNQENHAFFTLIDFSGSMSQLYSKVIENELIVAIFCREAGIPHRSVLYASRFRYNNNHFLFETDMTQAEFDRTVELCYHFVNKTPLGGNIFRQLAGGTPLRDSILNIANYIEDWAGRKITILALTDGACGSSFKIEYFTRDNMKGKRYEYNLSGCFEYLKDVYSNISVSFVFMGSGLQYGLNRNLNKVDAIDHGYATRRTEVTAVYDNLTDHGEISQLNLKNLQNLKTLEFGAFDSVFSWGWVTHRRGAWNKDPSQEVSQNLRQTHQKVADTYDRIVKRQNKNKEMEFFTERFLDSVA